MAFVLLPLWHRIADAAEETCSAACLHRPRRRDPSFRGPTRRLVSPFAHQYLWLAGKEETLLGGFSHEPCDVAGHEPDYTVG